MTDLQEKAMRMALDYIRREGWTSPQGKEVWLALRQALEQPGQGYALIHKDVLRAWGKLDEIESACCYPVSKEKEIAGLALAQPAQEPYGWISNEDGWFRKHEIADLAFKADAIPLYTAPPKKKWVGLTDDMFLEIWKEAYEPGYSLIELAKRVAYETEAKLKEKNT